MTHQEKLNYMSAACGIAGFGFHAKDLDMIVSLYDLILKKKGKTDLRSIVALKLEVKERDDAKTRGELLDKVSEKVGGGAVTFVEN
jgi:hypothetical protein